MTVLKTRLYKPNVKDGHLVRQRLLDKMEKNHYKPMHLVIGAAGYGKSVLISQWLDHIQTNYCWISLDQDCNDVKTFLAYLYESIRLIFPDTVSDLIEIVAAVEFPGVARLGQIVINELEEIDNKFIIVFDDYHHIKNKEVHSMLNEIINNIPQKHKIVIISRFTPPMKLGKLSAYDKVNEIGMGDLRFTIDEIKDLANNLFSERIEIDQLKSILSITEGWIVPIRLKLKELADRKSINLDIDRYNLTKKTISDFLVEELFLPEHPVLKESLMLASLFQRFSIRLLLELFLIEYPDENRKQAELEELIRQIIGQSLFIISLDDEKIWYRFHHLIQEFLQARSKHALSKERIDKALKYGSRFFEALGSLEEAIQLSIQAEDFETSCDIIERHRHKYINAHKFNILENWLKMIPSGLIEKQPSLLIIRALLKELTRDIPGMSRDLQTLQALLMPLDNELGDNCYIWGEYYSLLSIVELYNGNMQQVLNAASKAMDLLPFEYTFFHDFALYNRVVALNAFGKSNEAQSLLNQHKNNLKHTQRIKLLQINTITLLLGIIQGKIDMYTDEAHIARDISIEFSVNNTLIMADYYLAVSYYLKNELDEGRTYLDESLQNKFSVRPGWIIHCYYHKCLYLLAEDRFTEYSQCLMDMVTYANSYDSPTHKNDALLLQIELNLRQGNVEASTKLSRNVNFDFVDVLHRYYRPQLTEVKLLIAIGQSKQLNRADNLIIKYEEIAHTTHDRNLLIQVICLKMILLAKKNKMSEALKLLRMSLSNTQNDGFIRLYTDHGSDMENLINKLSDDEHEDPYLKKIIQSFKRTKNYKASSSLKHPSGGLIDQFSTVPNNETQREIDKIANRGLKNPLSNLTKDDLQIVISLREQEIIKLTATGLRNKEIAEQLNISELTVKSHLTNIYKKFNVSNRTTMVKKARDLQITS